MSAFTRVFVALCAGMSGRRYRVSPSSPRSRSAPSPLVGEGWGGGDAVTRQRCLTQPPPPLTPPHKGEGNTTEYAGRGSAPSARRGNAPSAEESALSPGANSTTPRALLGARTTGPRPMLKAPMLLAAGLGVCVGPRAAPPPPPHHGH